MFIGNHCWRRVVLAVAVLLSLGMTRAFPAEAVQHPPLPLPDGSGMIGTFTTNGSIDFTNPFFQNLGTNQRTCATCHVNAEGWSFTPVDVRVRFLLTGGTEPIFRTNDGSNCDTLDVSTVSARWAAYSLLIKKGLLRIAIAVPTNAEFTVAAVDNPIWLQQPN